MQASERARARAGAGVAGPLPGAPSGHSSDPTTAPPPPQTNTPSVHTPTQHNTPRRSSLLPLCEHAAHGTRLQRRPQRRCGEQSRQATTGWGSCDRIEQRVSEPRGEQGGGRHAGGRRRVLRDGEPQVREAGVPVPGEPLPDAAAGAGHGGDGAGARPPRPRGAPGPVALSRPRPRPHPLLRVPRRLRRHRLRHVPPQARVPCRLRLLQAPRQLPRPLRHLHGAHAPHQRRRQERALPDQDPRAVRARGGHVPPARQPLHPAQPKHGGIPRRGPARHLLRHRRPRPTHGTQAQGHRHPRRQLQPLLPDAVPLRHDHQQVQAPKQHPQLQPLRHGLQRRPHLHRSRARHAPGAPELERAGGVDGDHHAKLLPGHPAGHAAAELPVPDGRGGDPAVEPASRGPARQVPAGARGEDAQGRRRPGLPVRVPGGGRAGVLGHLALQGAHGHRRRRAQVQHHHHRPTRAAHVGAAALLLPARGPEAREQEVEAVHPGLQAGVRALLHPRRGACRDRRAAEEPAAVGEARGGVADDAAPVREHVQQLALVRARLHRGQGTDAPRRPRLADRLRLRVQVQQRRVEVPPQHQDARQRAMGRLHRPLPGRDPGDRQAVRLWSRRRRLASVLYSLYVPRNEAFRLENWSALSGAVFVVLSSSLISLLFLLLGYN